MKPTEHGVRAPAGACADCLRRSWLLAVLGARLDYSCREEGRLIELLALGDEELLQAVAGRRKEELKVRYADFAREQISKGAGASAFCRHDHRYPAALDHAGAPRMLNVAGGVPRLVELTGAPVVAIIGSRRATDYGMEMAKSLARGLAVSGVTIVSGLADGIAVAAHAGTLEVAGRPVVVMSGGLDVACPARRCSLYERAVRLGCAIAELPCGWPARRWGTLASERIVVGLARLTVVVEAGESPAELAGARIARAQGRTLAAVPGRVTSPSSRGTHALLIGGAHLVRGPGDVLELLYRTGSPGVQARADAPEDLEPRLKRTLERVGAGRDTADSLTHEGADAAGVLLALSELELLGLLGRGDGGRYVPRDPRDAIGCLFGPRVVVRDRACG
jgi:DNA processing protein